MERKLYSLVFMQKHIAFAKSRPNPIPIRYEKLHFLKLPIGCILLISSN